MTTFPFPEELRARYEPRRELGRGGMGVVLLAFDRQLQREVVIKLSLDGDNPELAARAAREAQGLAGLQHPNVLRVFDAGRTAEGPYLVTEHLVGTPLDQLPPGVALGPVFRQLAEGLQAVHDAGLLHRDLKPANMFLEDTGRALLIDFGLVRDARRTQITRTGQVLGTMAYMAPECFQGHRATTASDWYAWGASLYACLEGRPPFSGPELLLHATEGAALRPAFRHTPPAAQPAMTSLLSPNPASRPARPQADLWTFLAPSSATTSSILREPEPLDREAPTVVLDAAAVVHSPAPPTGPPPTLPPHLHRAVSPPPPPARVPKRHAFTLLAAGLGLGLGLRLYRNSVRRAEQQAFAEETRLRHERATHEASEQARREADVEKRRLARDRRRQAELAKKRAVDDRVGERKVLWVGGHGPPILRKAGAVWNRLLERGAPVGASWDPTSIAPYLQTLLDDSDQGLNREAVGGLIEATDQDQLLFFEPQATLLGHLLSIDAIHQVLRRANSPAPTWASELRSRWMPIRVEHIERPATEPIYSGPRPGRLGPQSEALDASIPAGAETLEVEVVYELPSTSVQAPRLRLGLHYLVVLEQEEFKAGDEPQVFRWVAQLPAAIAGDSTRARLDLRYLAAAWDTVPYTKRDVSIYSFEVREASTR